MAPQIIAAWTVVLEALQSGVGGERGQVELKVNVTWFLRKVSRRYFHAYFKSIMRLKVHQE